ncbi:COG2363 [Crocosphaera watsonii WH 8502]|uniref:COG2363 n=1 Tax=Crocosphaera watsonii WH 8502 TaxID=423474 RepID=T2IGY1_CROWT|nr:COG2363 [Crocosphaera watsonii WH 8502]
MVKIFLFIGSILAGLSVAGGAFASHALKDRLSDRFLEIFETGTKYQMYHALALILVALLLNSQENTPITMVGAGYAFIIGILIFSGSLYALSLTGIKWLGGDRSYRWGGLDHRLAKFRDRSLGDKVN